MFQKAGSSNMNGFLKAGRACLAIICQPQGLSETAYMAFSSFQKLFCAHAATGKLGLIIEHFHSSN
jgi:hypothetical protein